MDLVLSLIIISLMGYWCYTIAKRKGRSKALAIFMGLLFGIIAVIVYAILKPTKEVQLKNAEKLLEGEPVKVKQK